MRHKLFLSGLSEATAENEGASPVTTGASDPSSIKMSLCSINIFFANIFVNPMRKDNFTIRVRELESGAESPKISFSH